ncbi:uncharacterized protein LOC125042766 [Penaeus chinensis]|uniref:uncharacterized protein LOC125042766 n=1 Tax=Penaeus chinensis TaxID=139456 RepID=UPI001FB6CEB1|nr:uncharacterized protein LOC125042766 [Penaeus chinensis]
MVVPRSKKTPVLLCLLLVLEVCSATAYDPEASITGLYTGPYFDPLAPRNLTAHLGDEATLPCTVRQLGDKSVSWVRMRDADILTVDRYTFVGDERFESHYSAELETWNLVIKYVQERDAGQYECQVSTEPKMSQLFNLRVVIPKVTIVPPGDRFVKAGSTVRVDCQITDVVQLPDYIFWYLEDRRVMDHQDPNLLVTVKRTGAESITSTLTIHRVRREESGNYTCMPSNLHAASVTLHVLNEKHPAAMQAETSGAGGVQAGKLQLLVLLLFLLASTSSLALNEEDNKADTKPRETVDQDPPATATSPSASSLLPLPPCSSLSAPLPPVAHALRGLDKEGTLEILRDLLAVLPESDNMADLPAKCRGFPSVQEGQVTAGRSWRAGGGQSGFPAFSPRLLTKAEVPLVLEGDPLASFLETLARPRVSAIDNPAHLDDRLLCLDLAHRPSAARACDRPRLPGEGERLCVGAVPSCELRPVEARKPRPARWSASVQATR